MVEQVLDQQKCIMFKFSQEEKELFFDYVNMLPKGVYNKSEEIDSAFMEAIRKDDFQAASNYLQQLSWNRIALKIISYVRKSKTYSSDEDKRKLLKDFNLVVEKQHSSNSPSKIIKCPYCNGAISEEAKTCLCCGGVIDDY